MSQTPDAQPTGWLMGLSGVWGQLANLSAVGLMCLLLYQSVQEQYRQARDDREMFRSELQRLQRGQEDTARALQEITAELRRLKKE